MMRKIEQDKLANKIEDTKEGIVKTVTSPKAVFIAIVIGVAFTLAISLVAFYLISKWYDYNRVVFQRPSVEVTVYWPVVIQDRKVNYVDAREKIISPIPEDATPSANVEAKKTRKQTLLPINSHVDLAKLELVQNSEFPSFVNHIWIHESGQGTNENPAGLHNVCSQKGMSNEFGFYPQGMWCWNTFEEGISRLERWYRENKDLTDNQKLCYYNGAGKVEDCPYLYDDYLSMK